MRLRGPGHRDGHHQTCAHGGPVGYGHGYGHEYGYAPSYGYSTYVEAPVYHVYRPRYVKRHYVKRYYAPAYSYHGGY